MAGKRTKRRIAPGHSRPGPKRKAPPTAFKKGHPKVGGRKKGTPNKFTRDIKEGLLTAYEELGGPEFFVRLGRSFDDRKVIANLFGKLLPIQMAPGGETEPEKVAAKVREHLAKLEKVTAGGDE